MNPVAARERHPSSFQIEAVRAGAASAEERAWVDEHVGGCARCAALASAWNDARRTFTADVYARTSRAVVERASAPAPRPWRLWFGGAVLAPAAAALVLVALHRPAADVGGPAAPLTDEPEVTAKGGSALVIVARRAERVFPVRAGEPLQKGDSIRFVLERVSQPFVM